MITVPMGFDLLNIFSSGNKPSQKSREILVKKSTLADFFAVADSNPTQRFELVQGHIIAISNASIPHNTIINNFVILLGGLFMTGNLPCRIYAEANCKVNEENCFQPDFAVICHKPTSSRYIENPIVVGEVLSSNRKDDLTVKLPIYQSTDSIKEICYLEQDKMVITVYRRGTGTNWRTIRYEKGDVLRLESIDLAMPIEHFYRDVVA